MHPNTRLRRLHQLAAEREAEAAAAESERRSWRYRVWLRGRLALSNLVLWWDRIMCPPRARLDFLRALGRDGARPPASGA